jgi:competence protein ComGC
MNGEPVAMNPTKPKTNGLAITSLVLGILSMIVCGVGIVLAIPGLICGFMGMKRVKNSGGVQKGWGLALAGTIMSGLVILMFPLFALIAIPNFVKARELAQKNGCIVNLRGIEDAKEMWALENKKTSSAVPTDSDLFGPGKVLTEKPHCPKGGTYSYNRADQKPTCTVPGHEIQ